MSIVWVVAGDCGLCGHPNGGHTPAGLWCKGCEGRCVPEPEYLGTIWEGNEVAKTNVTPQEKALAVWYAMGNIEKMADNRTWLNEFINQQRKVRSLLLGEQFQKKSKDTRLVEVCAWFAEMLGDALGDPDVAEQAKSFLAAKVAFSVRFSGVAGAYQPEPDDPDYVE